MDLDYNHVKASTTASQAVEMFARATFARAAVAAAAAATSEDLKIRFCEDRERRRSK